MVSFGNVKMACRWGGEVMLVWCGLFLCVHRAYFSVAFAGLMVPGLWACVIYGWYPGCYAWFPVCGVWFWWFCFGLMPFSLSF